MTTAFPLKWPAGWPRTPEKLRKGIHAFRGLTPSKARDSLVDEIHRLGGQHLVISTNAQVDKRGLPNVSSLELELEDPGVAIYFLLDGKEMVMAQDRFDAPFANCRSLALAVEAMRTIERHGGGTMMQRAFQGFSALPPPSASSAPAQRPWREVLNMQDVSQSVDATMREAFLLLVDRRFRDLARSAHSDAGGSDAAMAELNRARDEAKAELGGGT